MLGGLGHELMRAVVGVSNPRGEVRCLVCLFGPLWHTIARQMVPGLH